MPLPEIDWGTLTDEELEQLINDARTEQTYRITLANAEADAEREKAEYEAQIDVIAQRYHSAKNAKDGVEGLAEWVQPTGAHDAYPLGWQVEHEGKVWESLVSANVWEPGVSGWREIIIDDDPDNPAPPPAWVQPTGAHDAYAAGALVTHNGFIWQSDVDGNVWEPGVYGWTQLEAAPTP